MPARSAAAEEGSLREAPQGDPLGSARRQEESRGSRVEKAAQLALLHSLPSLGGLLRGLQLHGIAVQDARRLGDRPDGDLASRGLLLQEPERGFPEGTVESDRGANRLALSFLLSLRQLEVTREDGCGVLPLGQSTRVVEEHVRIVRGDLVRALQLGDSLLDVPSGDHHSAKPQVGVRQRRCRFYGA